MSDIRRPKHVLNFDFASGATQSGPQSLAGVSGIALICDSDFNTDTLTLKTSVPGDTGVEVTAATGRVNIFDPEQMAGIAPMNDLIIETDTATAGAARIVVLCYG